MEMDAIAVATEKLKAAKDAAKKARKLEKDTA